jgi:hypothetical protein
MKDVQDTDQSRIQLLSYDKPSRLTERYFFSEMSILQVTRLFSTTQRIASCRIEAYTPENKCANEELIPSIDTVGALNEFVSIHSDYSFVNCDIELYNGIHIECHDMGEVSIELQNDNTHQGLITSVFDEYGIDKKLIPILKARPGHYVLIDGRSNVVEDFQNFDDYIRYVR